ncbi:MAG: hypothetical protein E6J90_00685 [Deltaproteobacteria bacterium]|nr:MAG: hypothetical protein E6J90_00685 [Deltaproteobacteria bacterium]
MLLGVVIALTLLVQRTREVAMQRRPLRVIGGQYREGAAEPRFCPLWVAGLQHVEADFGLCAGFLGPIADHRGRGDRRFEQRHPRADLADPEPGGRERAQRVTPRSARRIADPAQRGLGVLRGLDRTQRAPERPRDGGQLDQEFRYLIARREPAHQHRGGIENDRQGSRGWRLIAKPCDDCAELVMDDRATGEPYLDAVELLLVERRDVYASVGQPPEPTRDHLVKLYPALVAEHDRQPTHGAAWRLPASGQAREQIGRDVLDRAKIQELAGGTALELREHRGALRSVGIRSHRDALDLRVMFRDSRR